jgi:hypothetical protein
MNSVLRLDERILQTLECRLWSDFRSALYWDHVPKVSKYEAARLAAHPQRDDNEAEAVCDERLKVANGIIRKNTALTPRSQPRLYDGHIKRLLSGHFLPPVDPGPDAAAQRVMDGLVKRTKMLQKRSAGK